MSFLYRAIDTSPWISRLIERLSPALAKRRGWPLLIGTVLIVVSFLGFGAVIIGLVWADEISNMLLWLCLPLTVLHIGIFAGFTGLLLAIPLGEAYRDTD